jgi:hypothetical protein
MKLWPASTDASRVQHLFDFGLFAGVLTNPATLDAAGRPVDEILRDLCAATVAPVFYQLRDGSAEDLRRQADRWLSRGWANLRIKVPLTPNGCRTLHWLREQRITLRLDTAVATPADLLPATALDVPLVTPASSALEKRGGPSKRELLAGMQELLERQSSPLRLIPSLGSPAEMCDLAGAERVIRRVFDGHLVIKRGAHGARWWEAGSSAGIGFATKRIRPINTVGAGDVFNGALLAAYDCGADVPAALHFANAVAASVVSSPRGVLGLRVPPVPGQRS